MRLKRVDFVWGEATFGCPKGWWGMVDIAREADCKNLPRCTSPITSSPPDPSQITSSAQFLNGIRVHEPWHITWRQADVSSLTPQPPENENWNLSAMWFLMIGLPIIVVALFGGCVWFKCDRHKQREREREMQQGVLLNGGKVEGSDPTGIARLELTDGRRENRGG